MTQTYYLILVAENNRSILQSSLDNLNKTLYEVQELYNEGFVEETDVKQLQISVTQLKNNINIASSAWALVNSHGDSELGIWPLYVGNCQFNLVLMGAPQFNQQAFVDLIWVLSKRYLDLPDSY